jgi:uncharacterized membrane protein YfcA
VAAGLDGFTQALHLGVVEFALVFLSAMLGALVQGAIGFGLNLVVVPVVAILEPAALPAAMIIMALPMTAGSAIREHSHIDRSGVLWTTLGRLPGVAAGAFIVSILASDVLALVIGGFVVLAAVLSILSPPLSIRPASAALVGLVSGVMGTASSIGGPPVALLYQNQPGPIMRSTLGATFLIGTAMSLAALAIAGQVEVWQVWLGLALMPGIGFGLYASRWLHGWLDRGWLRPCVLGFAVFSGIAVMLRGVA